MLKIFMLEISQVDYLLGLLRDGPHIHLLQPSFVDYDHAAEALRQCLQLQMPSPLSVLTHRLQIVLESAILILIQKRFEKLLVPGHKATCLISHENMRSLIAVHLISKGPKEAIAITSHVPNGQFERSDFLLEGFKILAVVPREFEGIGLGHLLAQLHLHLLVHLALVARLLDHALAVLLLTHNSFIIQTRPIPAQPIIIITNTQIPINTRGRQNNQIPYLPVCQLGRWLLPLIIISRMFILSNIKVNTSEVLFFPDARKFLKFQINRSTKKHPFPSRFISPHEIGWDAQLTFPQALYGRSIAFEIYIKHEFGYHENQLSSMLLGEMKVERDATLCTFQLHRALDTQCIGYLSCRVRHRGETVEQMVETKIARKQVLIIKSIIAHIPAAVNKKILFRVAVGRQEVATVPIRTICGDLVFPDRMVINKTDIQRQATISMYQKNNDFEVKLGEGKISLLVAKPDKKVILMKQQQVLGEAYVDCIQEDKDDPTNPLKRNSLPNYLHKIKPNSESLMKNTTMTGRITQFKKISVVSPNQSIVFSTSQRFQDAVNPEFMGTRSSNRTKMSLGQLRKSRRLNKSNQSPLFSIEEETPGVGRYKLPTIWDRY